MPAPFFKLSKRLLKACPDDWIITPNERLAREFRRAYDARQLQLGQTVWAAPRAVSISGFVASRAAQAVLGSSRSGLLPAEAELLLWQEVGESGQASLCELAAHAWRLVHAYRIDLDDQAFAATANARTFRHWARRFRERLRVEGLVTQAELADRLPGAAERLHLVAFDVITPQVADLLQRIESAGGLVRHHPPGAMRNGPHKRVQTADRAAEIHAAAQWSRRVLARYPNSRIAVVFPYLMDAYQAISNAFMVEFDDAPRAVDVSGGVPLGEQPVWRDAELLLRLATGEISHRELLRLGRSPWLHLGDPLKVPSDAPEMLNLRHLPRASEVLRQLARRAGGFPQRQAFAQWIADFRSLLTLGRWNAASAGSGQYQAYGQLTESLERFGRFAQLPSLTGVEALQTLQRHLSARLFAPQRPPAPVQVLGYLETTGLVFTHLWIAGLQDTAWPAAPNPNPLLPIPLQRVHGVPRTDHPMEAEFAIRQTRLWRRASRYTVVSHAARDGDEQHRCSALVESVPVVDIGKLVPRYRARRHPWLSLPNPASLKAVTEVTGTALSERLTRGGSSLLRDQAQCPFRAWAIHRLHLAETREVQDFPDALERGTLIHEALFELYDNGAPPFDDADIARAAASALAARLRQAPDLYRRHERQRLRNLLRTWVEFEAGRPDFTVIGLEKKTALDLPELRLSLRIDRIDRDRATGGQVVLDYKTGSVSAGRLLDDRLTEPQLPMYALTNPGIRATLYAELGSDRAALKGLSSEELGFGRARVQKLSGSDWEHLRARWKSQIEALVGEFRSGLAAVQPTSPTVCDRCHLPAFCRVHARTPAGDAPVAADTGEAAT